MNNFFNIGNRYVFRQQIYTIVCYEEYAHGYLMHFGTSPLDIKNQVCVKIDSWDTQFPMVRVPENSQVWAYGVPAQNII